MNVEHECVFAIDIGTRKVAGLIVDVVDNAPKIKHYVVKEHSERTMEDGQIHDVPKVAQLVTKVKKELEEATGLTLEKASVAAAGRLLVTVEGTSKIELFPGEVLSETRVKALELEAVHQAQKGIAERQMQRSDSFYCVGYSVLGYTIDRNKINNLVGQKGQEAGVEIIATFLPRIVVDSLTAVLQRAGLEFSSMTLEPIAASHVAIPKDMRRLNLALVDIGAGTSDIAITSDGTVVAYGMVPKAGDEITEHLCDRLLLDFLTAEELKRAFAKEQGLRANEEPQQSQFTYTDILGFEQIISRQELAELINEVTENLAKEIAKEILRLNVEPPQAVILVGGGSLTPFITENLANALGIDNRRIGRRGKEILNLLGFTDDSLIGPIFVTPIGIALATLDRVSLTMHNLYLNGNMLTLLSDGRTLKISDVLINGGYNSREIYGTVGVPLTVYLNEEPLIIPGKRGKGATIYLNGEPVSVDTPINQILQSSAKEQKKAIKIDVVSAQVGEAGKATLKDVILKDNPLIDSRELNDFVSKLGKSTKTITWEGTTYELREIILVNGRAEPLDYELNEGDSLTIQKTQTVEDALKILEIEGKFDFNQVEKALNSFYYLNGQKIELLSNATVRLNGKDVDLKETIKSGDVLSFVDKTSFPKLYELIPKENSLHVNVLLDNKQYQFEFPVEYKITVNGKEELLGYSLRNQDKVVVEQKKVYIIADVLAKLTYEINQLQTKELMLTKNGVLAMFTTPIRDGDLIEIS